LNHNPKCYFFLSILKNRLSDQVKRGSIVKALAICSKTTNVYLESLTKVAEAALDTIFDKTDVNGKLETNISQAT
jgi:hypothetical protein